MIKLSTLTFTILILFLNGCVELPDDLIMPNWDVELNVPVLNKTYTLDDLIESSDDISFEPSPTDNIYVIKTNSFNGGVPLSDYIRVASETSLQNIPLPATDSDSTILYIGFPDGIEIEEAKFSSGNILVNVQNPSPVDVTTSIKFPGIITPDGNQLNVNIIIPANSSNSVDYPLENCSYKFPENQDPSLRDSLQFIPSVRASQTLGTYIILDFYCSDFLFESIEGIMPRTFLGTKTIPIKLNFDDIENYRDKISFKEITFNLNANYNSSISNPFELALYNLRIYGKRSDGEEKTLHMMNGSNIDMELLNGRFNLTLNENNSNLKEFISFLPDSINILADFYLNPQGDVDLKSTSVLDSVKIDTDILTRAILSLKNTTITDTTDLELSNDDRESLADGNTANLTIEVENAIPFTAFLKIVLTDENFNPLLTLTKNFDGGDSLFFLGGEIDSRTGEVISPSNSKNFTILDINAISQIAKAHYAVSYVTVRTKDALDGVSSPPYVNLKSTDWIKVRCYGKVNYRFNPEDDSENE